MTIATRLFTFFKGHLVGADPFGNRYYRERRKPKKRREKRWVIYNGVAEPSKVPPDWHGWLHHTAESPPNVQHRTHYGWEKPPLPNLTGTGNAYLPPGHLVRGAKHAPTVAEYEPWKP